MSAPSKRAWPQPLAETWSDAGHGLDHGLITDGLKPGRLGAGRWRGTGRRWSGREHDVTERRLQRRGEHAHAHDQGEADHQGGSRRGRTTRVAHRVLLGQLARQAAQPQRRADQRRERADRERQRRPSRRPAPRPGRARTASCSAPPYSADSIAGDAGRRVSASPMTARRFDGGSRARGRLAQRLDRQHLGGPASRDERGDDGDDGADEQRDPDGARLDLQRRARQAEADRRPSAR